MLYITSDDVGDGEGFLLPALKLFSHMDLGTVLGFRFGHCLSSQAHTIACLPFKFIYLSRI